MKGSQKEQKLGEAQSFRESQCSSTTRKSQ